MRLSLALPNLQGGGAERVALYLANHWAAQGMQVEFVLMEAKGELLDLVDPRIPIHSLKASRIRGSILPLRRYFAERKPAVAWVLRPSWPGSWPVGQAPCSPPITPISASHVFKS